MILFFDVIVLDIDKLNLNLNANNYHYYIECYLVLLVKLAPDKYGYSIEK